MEDNGVSVITICRNSEDLIQETMVSVLNQKYDNFEYIIVDGASTDHTVDLIEQMLKKFTDKGICVDFRSEMDKGIQDAENKGLQRATNKWSILLHAGDTFVDDLVLHRVFTEKDFSNIHGVYGDTVYCWDKYDWVKKPQPFETIFSGLTLPFCTQSVFVRTEVYRKYGFNSEYSPAADYHLFSQLFVEGHQFTYCLLYTSRCV